MLHHNTNIRQIVSFGGTIQLDVMGSIIANYLIPWNRIAASVVGTYNSVTLSPTIVSQTLVPYCGCNTYTITDPIVTMIVTTPAVINGNTDQMLTLTLGTLCGAELLQTFVPSDIEVSIPLAILLTVGTYQISGCGIACFNSEEKITVRIDSGTQVVTQLGASFEFDFNLYTP